MKNFLLSITLTLASTTGAFAQQSIPPKGKTLQCTSGNGTGNRAEWSPQFGELRVFNKRSQVFIDQDALVYKAPRYIETFPPKWSSKIVYGDEQDSPVIAEILQFGKVIQLIVYGDTENEVFDTFFCQQP